MGGKPDNTPKLEASLPPLLSISRTIEQTVTQALNNPAVSLTLLRRELIDLRQAAKRAAIRISRWRRT
jgi:hypothetical protein